MPLELGLETVPLLATSGALSSGLLLSPPLPAPLPVPLGASLLELGPEPVPSAWAVDPVSLSALLLVLLELGYLLHNQRARHGRQILPHERHPGSHLWCVSRVARGGEPSSPCGCLKQRHS